MGVQGLWQVVQPCARPTNLATLNRKRLAVDASIWIYQFLKAVRDKEGNALRNSHVVGFFRRICKLLWFGIKPVFVFDGGAPALKRATLQGRRRRREGRREDAVRTAGKLLAVQMQRIAQEEDEKRKAKRDAPVPEAEEELPAMENMVYADEVFTAPAERAKKDKKFFRQDQYHLPDLDSSIESMGRPDDPRIMSVEQLEEYARQFNSGEDVNLYDFSKIDFDGEFFKSLPPADRYNILNAARLRSRLRLGLSKEQLDAMFPNRMDFSRFQIERVQERNRLTQRLMLEQKMTGLDLTINGGGRIAGEGNREYILVKNDGVEGGYALGVLTQEKDIGQQHKPIDVDALQLRYAANDEDEESDLEDEEFEDVPIEGVNRLPKRRGQPSRPQVEESLFVEQDDQDQLMAAEDDDIARAIELSLKNQHSAGKESEEVADDEFEDVPVPQWEQRAVAAPKPITSTSGSMVAHIINNRANAAVPKKTQPDNDSSDSEGDLRSALAAARRRKKAEPKPSAPILPNVKNPFGGPLPFEKLDWRTSIFEKKPEPKSDEQIMKEANDRVAETGGGFQLEFPLQGEEANKEANLEGGFEKEPVEDDAPRPLPPWMINDDTDIREQVEKQRLAQNEINEEDERFAQDEELLRRRKRQNDIIEIESSDDDDDDDDDGFEIVDAPPVKSAPLAKAADTGYTYTIPSPPKAMPEPSTAAGPEFTVETISSPASPTREAELGISQTAVAVSQSPSNGVEFEDVEMPEVQTAPEMIAAETGGRQDSEEPIFEDVVLPVAEPSPRVSEGQALQESTQLIGDDITPMTPRKAQQATVEDIGNVEITALGDEDDLFAEGEYDEFSDPEDEQLLVQMAEEAEEHARFASELNKKPAYQNQEDYERELRQLRSQQKKDRRDADEVTQIMVTECQALLSLFGIPYITAPMEAEAQCAELVTMGLVDGIVTDDSDIFLFGGTRVYKNMFNSNKLVECYLASDLEKELSLSREQLISIAHLLGSDYTEGIPGIGPVTAIEILSEFPGREGLEKFKEWWTEVQSNPNRPKDAESSAFRRKFRKSNAAKLFLPPSFPSPPVYDAYMQPDVDKDPQQFQWGVPDLEGLRRFLMATIGWSQERTDEVLVPVIRDMNKRGVEGTQSNITRYFEGSLGVGAKEAFAPRQRAKASRRMAAAVDKLRTRADKEALDEAGDGGEAEVSSNVENDKSSKVNGTRKRKSRTATVVESDGEEDVMDSDADFVEDGQEKSNGNRTRKRAKGKGKSKV
ncbi:DNA repair protein rad2 [Gnomoniopsis smithogilvyi]|uniref:DNA repair protein rad2 n=1 Tax=Gnomoniopsis smithogilvyi TaxID=1191159 RepID=A0A9W8Z1Q9_9PEZI|nr:DNA repair protein rad2 [Gnomoniopsis smithogilvyi]